MTVEDLVVRLLDLPAAATVMVLGHTGPDNVDAVELTDVDYDPASNEVHLS